MIHYLRQEEKSRSRKLWEEIFVEDSQSFVDFYYAEKARRNKILVAEEDNEIVAMLHRNPFDVVVKDRIWRIDYIAGVATAAAWRHQGYMSRLLSRIFADMYMEKMGFCFLHPVNPVCPKGGFLYPFNCRFPSGTYPRNGGAAFSLPFWRGSHPRTGRTRSDRSRSSAYRPHRFLRETT